MKKAYLQPKTKVVLVKTENLLEGSLNDNKSGNPDLARWRFYNDDEEEEIIGW